MTNRQPRPSGERHQQRTADEADIVEPPGGRLDMLIFDPVESTRYQGGCSLEQLDRHTWPVPATCDMPSGVDGRATSVMP